MSNVDGGYGGKDTTSTKPTGPTTVATGGGGLTGNEGTGPGVFDFGDGQAGFGLGQGLSLQEYNGWLAQAKADPGMGALIAAYGPAFQSFAWDAYRTGMDNTRFLNLLFGTFPGAKEVLAKAGSSGSRGGGGGGFRGGGGGGGVSKAQQYAAAEAEIRNQVQTMGLGFTDSDIKAIAKTTIDQSWSGAQLTDYLLGGKVVGPGTINVSVDQVKAMAKAQMVKISDASAQEWARRIASGEMELATVGNILMTQAVKEYGWAKEQLVAGATMRDILMPTRDMIASELEIGAETVDLMDDRWKNMAQVKNEDGTMRSATLTEVQRAARKDVGWAKTNGAARLASQTARMIRNVFEG